MTALLSTELATPALVADAVRAPSSHNTQPWLFRLLPRGVEVHADRTRALPVNDPQDRELVMSVGAALTNLCVAAVHQHLLPTVELQPSDDPDHLATVWLEPAPAYRDERLSYGIRLRGTWREDFTAREVPDDVVAEVLDAARSLGAWAEVVPDRAAFVELVGLAEHAQFSDPHWRRELASWMHPRRTGDGLAVPAAAGAFTRFVVSHVDVGDRTAQHDAALCARAPVLVVLGTETDDEAAWLTAGRALEALLLTGAVVGVQGGFVNAVCQVPEVRARTAALVDRPFPQVALRLGYPPEPPRPSARRPLEDVLLP